LSDYDLQRFDEKYIKILPLAYLFMSKIYVPMSEYETVPLPGEVTTGTAIDDKFLSFVKASLLAVEIEKKYLFHGCYCFREVYKSLRGGL
jgi:hypothetical protein